MQLNRISPTLVALFLLFTAAPTSAQMHYWQQRADYKMQVQLNHENHSVSGSQVITYTNNSPDTLKVLYYYLFFNAFQPGSMMDVKSITSPDPDRRVQDRISKLKPEEIGYTRVKELTLNGKKTELEERETILVVTLPDPILPNSTVELALNWEGQVPVQIRRSGRFNREGIHYTMTQWFPKICVYDYEGWHAHQYVGREFYGNFGDYHVEIEIDKKYTVAGTGVLQNPEKIGKGYIEDSKVNLPQGDKLNYIFKAKDVIDFAWAADPNYVHKTHQVPNGPLLRFFYHDKFEKNWSLLPAHMEKVFLLMNKYFGTYPYPEYGFIMGGDGGMEYPMCTMILGGGSIEGLFGVSTHEAIHSWYQGILATNEAVYPWMDEGFTSFAEDMVLDSIYQKNSLNAHLGAYGAYYSMVKANAAEPLTTHADHYKSNRVYAISTYYKGQIFLNQLAYIVGTDALLKGMKNFWDIWKFKHPTPRDFIHVMQTTSGIQLGWYLENWIQTTKTIDYGIKSVKPEGKTVTVVVERIGEMPMPIDLVLTLKDGSTVNYNIPTNVQLQPKKENLYNKTEYLKPWPFTHNSYTVTLNVAKKDIVRMEIDPTLRMADIDRSNNVYPAENQKKSKDK
ncbi:MAG: M1 family metallopeptidase [Luteibaculaceae bacterium]